MTLLRRAAPAALALVAVVVVWDLGVRITGAADYLFPSPGEVAEALWRTRSALDDHLLSTLTIAIVGLAAGAVAGVVIALALAASDVARRAVEPLLVISQSVPAVILAPLFIVWFGFGMFPKVLVVALIAFFPIAIATLEGLRGADAEHVDLLRSLGAGRLETLRRVRIPSALPGFFAGMKVAAAYAVFGAVVAEWMGASVGLGVYLQRSQASFRTDQIFAAIVLIAIAGMVLYGLVSLAARLAMPWNQPTNEEELTR